MQQNALSLKHFSALERQQKYFWLLFIAILILGVFFRIQQISIQWLTDDEWHAVHKIIGSDGYAPILLSLGRADYSIPLTAFYKLLAETVGLSELRMRLPMLLSGIVFLVIAMLWIRARITARTALIFGFLIAISPLLVNYSRNARPYMLTLLLAGLATWSLAQWDRKGKWSFANTYLACLWLASWLHLIMAPFMLGLLAPLYAKTVKHRGGNLTGWRSLIPLSLLAILGILALNLPPLLHDPTAMTAKTGSNLPNFETLKGVMHVWLGSSSTIIVLIGLGLGVKGFARVRDALPLELSMWCSGLFFVLVGILVLQPAWVQNPLTFGRYLLPMLPLLLLLIAAGIEDVSRMGRTVLAQSSIALCLAAVFLIGTPHAALLRRPNNFTLHSYYQFDYRSEQNPVVQSFLPYKTPSPFWMQLAKYPPGTMVVAIAGQPSFESYFVLHPLYQPLHRQFLINLQTSGVCGTNILGETSSSHGIFLRNAVNLQTPEDMLRHKVDWVVLEYRQLQPESEHIPQSYQDFISKCRAELATRFGKPTYSDDYLVAFRVRREQSLR